MRNMTGVHALYLGLFACLSLAAMASPALADLPPGPSPSVNKNVRVDPAPQPPAMIDPITGQPIPVREEPRRRTGPFRSCGSGAGAGLAGIGLAWGLMWVGHRYSARVARGKGAGPRG